MIEHEEMDFCGELCIFAEGLIKKAKPQWIPVTERLPERNTEVLVCDTKEDFVSVWEYIGDGLWFGNEIIWATEDITHWMPLPESPKEEKHA